MGKVEFFLSFFLSFILLEKEMGGGCRGADWVLVDVLEVSM